MANMEDKRQRARVQGAWAGPAKSQAVAQPGKNLGGWEGVGLGCTSMCVQPSSSFIYILLVYNRLVFQLMLRTYFKM